MRKQASLILQICCAHFLLNVYLHRIRKLDTDKCQKCTNNRLPHQPRETINHFIFECTAYNEARDHLKARIGRDNFHISNIMTDANYMKELMTYINRTSRLKTK